MATAVTIGARKAKDGDGITSELADKMHSNLAARYMAVIEVAVDEVADLEDGTGKVRLVIETIEVAGRSSELDDYLRRLSHSMWNDRQEQPTLTSADDIEPGLDDLVKDGQIHVIDGDKEAVAT